MNASGRRTFKYGMATKLTFRVHTSEWFDFTSHKFITDNNGKNYEYLLIIVCSLKLREKLESKRRKSSILF